MTIFKKYLIGLFIIGLVFFTPIPAQAQAPERLTVLQATTTPGTNGQRLDIVFTITDGAGHAATGTEIEQATLQLPGGEPTLLSVAPATGPHYAVLLLDTNARIQEKLDRVLSTTKAAFDQLPANTYVSVVQFGVETQILTDFTNNVAQIRQSLDNISYYPISSTSCVYNALYQTTELLKKKVGHPTERASIVLFTDGNDELKHLSDQCVPRTYDEFKEMAITSNPLSIPIYTVGLCLDTPCTNLNILESNALAIDTRGFTFTSREAETNVGFERIMDRIRTQWSAQGEVSVGQGEYKANLAVKLRNREAALQNQISILSDRGPEPPTPTPSPTPTPGPGDTFTPPSPPEVNAIIPRLNINSFHPETAHNAYVLSVSIANPQMVHQLAVNVEDDGGVLITDLWEVVDQRASLAIEIDTSFLQAGQKYHITVTAHDQFGNLIEVDGDPVEDSKEVIIPFKRSPSEFGIQWVNVNLETNQLIIGLDIVAPEIEFDYEGFIINESGQQIAAIGPAPITNTQLRLPLPESMQRLTEEQTFEMKLYLTNTKEDQRLDPQTYDFTVAPSPSPTFWQRLGKTILIPFVLITILVILMGTIGWLLLNPRQTNSPEIYGPTADQLPPMA